MTRPFVQNGLAVFLLLCCLTLLVNTAPAPRENSARSMPLTNMKHLSQNHIKRKDKTPQIFHEQIENPSEVFSVLLIIGGDIVQKAIAQLAGKKVTFVSFSFGWVAYAFNALMSAFGDGQFMPPPDYPAVVITASSGIKKTNNSWVLGRLIRDLERKVEKQFETWIEDVKEDGRMVKNKTSAGDSGILITIFEAGENPATPKWDICWMLYFVVLPIQLVVAAIPVITKRNWSILFITAIGTALSVITGSLREWRLEKYSCRKGTSNTYILTRGNGHRHAFVIRPGFNSGLYLEDLAGATRTADLRTRVGSVLLALLWLTFLITAGGLKTDTWYLLAVGAIGMAQNVVVAGLPRSPEASGIPLRQIMPTFGCKKRGQRRPKIMTVLYEVENEFPGIGLAIRREYFPDYALRQDEIKFWEEKEDRQRALQKWKTRAKKMMQSQQCVEIVDNRVVIKLN